jgi:hypothetical protein
VPPRPGGSSSGPSANAAAATSGASYSYSGFSWSSPSMAASWRHGRGVMSDSGGRGASPPPPPPAVAAAAAGGGGGEPPAPLARPFPYVVPLVAKSCGVFFNEAERCTRVSREGVAWGGGGAGRALRAGIHVCLEGRGKDWVMQGGPWV